jgi:hypothetical protein
MLTLTGNSELIESFSIELKVEYNLHGQGEKISSSTTPGRTYRKEWKGWSDWLGTDRVQNQKKEFLPFEHAREFVRGLGLKSEAEWTEYRKSDKKPGNIPSAPRVVYGDEGWTSWGDWLGTGRIADQKTGWSITKVKELLRALIQSGTIYQWSEAVLYSFLIRKGLLNLAGSRHYQFFKNLIPASRTEEGQKAHRVLCKFRFNDPSRFIRVRHTQNSRPLRRNFHTPITLL